MQDLLRKLYVEDRMTTREIAPIVGKSQRTVARMLHKFGIPVNPPGPERHDILRDAKWLMAQYVDLGRSTTQIADEIGAQATLVSHWLKVHGIPARARGCHEPYVRTEAHRAATAARGKSYAGQANPNYKGGPDRENKTLRSSYQSKDWAKKVKTRDHWKCVDCGEAGKLHAHHLQSWKTHPELRFDVSNGVTVCVPCHEKRHGRLFPDWVHQKAEIATSANLPDRG